MVEIFSTSNTLFSVTIYSQITLKFYYPSTEVLTVRVNELLQRQRMDTMIFFIACIFSFYLNLRILWKAASKRSQRKTRHLQSEERG